MAVDDYMMLESSEVTQFHAYMTVLMGGGVAYDQAAFIDLPPPSTSATSHTFFHMLRVRMTPSELLREVLRVARSTALLARLP